MTEPAPEAALSSLLLEERRFPPPDAFRRAAHAKARPFAPFITSL